GDLPIQIAGARLDRYAFILIAVGANDIISFGRSSSAMKKFELALSKLPPAGQVVVHSAGNVGGTTLFPFFIRPVYTWLTKKYHAGFEKLAAEKGFTYVNLYQPSSEDPFVREPKVYLAPDGLHPSSEGYRAWFEKIRPAIRL
ncbi:MAG: GDSL-type esterase/lipase family protein, partial [Patescibacteria group bacterium]